jgi:hypothetical protein
MRAFELLPKAPKLVLAPRDQYQVMTFGSENLGELFADAH